MPEIGIKISQTGVNQKNVMQRGSVCLPACLPTNKTDHYHKAQKSVQDSRHTPAWVPGSRMEIRHAQAESSVDLETSVGCNHPDRWRFEGIIRWEDKFSYIDKNDQGEGDRHAM